MGWLADRYSRRNIIAAGVFIWSLMTAFSSLARGYVTLALARMGVGLGEATMNPCAFSMISDYFPRERLSTALSIYMMGIQLGSGLALIIGGVVVHAITLMPPIESAAGFGAMSPWRLTFLAVGLPGMLYRAARLHSEGARPPLAAEERSRQDHPHRAQSRAWQAMQKWQSVFGIALMIGSQALCNYTLLSWGPSYFERVHGWPRKPAPA